MGQLAGVFLLLMIGIGIPSVMFRGMSSGMLENPQLLTDILTKSGEMRLAILLSFLSSLVGLLFSVTAYRVLSQHNMFIAVTWLSLWIFQIAIATIGDVCQYVLVEHAQLTQDGILAADNFSSLAAVSVKGYEGAHFLSLIIFSGSFVFLHAHFWRFRLLPAWLTLWGILATGIVFTVTWLRIFEQSLSFHFYNQNGLFMIAFTIYMLIKGFKANEQTAK